MQSRTKRFRANGLLVLGLSGILAGVLAGVLAVIPAGSAASASAQAGNAPAAGPAAAPADPTDFVPEIPPTYKASGVTVEEKLGNVVPRDLEFRDHTGKVVTLREVMAGEVPTILTFNYSDCPMLCSLQLNGLSAVLDELAEATDLSATGAGSDAPGLVEVGRKAALQLGAQFRVVTIVLEPKQALAKTQATRASYLARLPEATRELGDHGPNGWTFLSAVDPGDGRGIAAVADSVGFRYTYIPERAEWAHPAALIFLSTAGTVTRYVYGTQFEAPVIRESIVKAGLAEASTAVGFMNRCYHFDPDANNRSWAGVLSLRIGGAAFLGLMILAFVGLRLRRRPRDPGVIQA
jgi:protein SCO1/2